MEATGTADLYLGSRLINQVANSLPSLERKGENGADAINACAAALHGIAPKDALEGKLAVQMVATHNLALDFMRKAGLSEQTAFGVEANTNHAVKMLRTFVAQMEALTRYRGRGQQKVVVEHVHVYRGGQAIVGAVTHPGEGGNAKGK